MKLLFVAPYAPSPPTFGGQRRIHGLMHALAKRHAISLLALHNPVDPLEEWRERTRALFPDAELFDQPAFASKGRDKRSAQLRSLLSARSWDDAAYRNEALAARLRERLASGVFDAVVVEFSQMAVNLSGLHTTVPCVVDEHNIEYDLQYRSAASSLNPLRRTFLEANWRKLRGEEQAVWRGASGVSVTSPRDQAMIEAAVPGVRCVVVPNGVDLTEFALPTGPPDAESVVFFGANNYFPNADGLRYFLADIWPLIRAVRPTAQLRVIGPAPPHDIVTQKRPGVTFEGFVEDIAAEVGRAAVVIAPLRIGGGTRLKVLEAMALGRAVVATSIGAEGIDLMQGRDVLLADTPRTFADAVLRLLADPGEASALGRRGRQRIVQAYSWTASAARLEALLEEVVARR